MLRKIEVERGCVTLAKPEVAAAVANTRSGKRGSNAESRVRVRRGLNSSSRCASVHMLVGCHTQQ